MGAFIRGRHFLEVGYLSKQYGIGITEIMRDGRNIYFVELLL